MNAVAHAKPSRLDQFRMEVLPPEKRQELVAGMPPHVRPERFERNLVNAMMQNPGLMDLDPRLIFREISKAAALGLYLDPQLGEAYLIESWNGKAKRKEPQLRIGYRGLIKLGRQSGEISMIYAHEVHEHDFFECSLGDQKSLVHKPDVFGERGRIVGYYAVVKYQDGETDFETLTVLQAHGIRDRSDGWKAFSDGKIKSTPWSTDEAEMSKKTVIRRLTKRIPQSPELAEAINIEDSAEHSEMRNITPQPHKPPVPPVPPPMEAIEDASEVEDAKVITPDETDHADRAEAAEEPFDVTKYFEDLEEALAVASDLASIEEVWSEADPMATFEGKPNAEVNQGIAKAIRKRAEKRIGGAA